MAEGSDSSVTEPVPAPLWRRMLADPERSPELLALAAAARFAAPAEEWAREHGGGRNARRPAKRALRRHVYMSRFEGLALGVGGLLTSAGNIAGLAWLQARMVFFIAASYGFDPRDPMRPAELLALWGVYETVEQARASLDGVGDPLAVAAVKTRLARGQERSLANRLARFVGRRAATRLGGRMVPLLGAPISAIQNGGSTKALGRKAIAYYGGGDPSPPDRQIAAVATDPPA